MSRPLTRSLAVVLSLWVGTGLGWAESVRVTGNAVRLRQAPRTTAAVVATVARGEALEVLEKSGDWYRVRTRAGVSGYVSARWVEPLTPAAAPPADSQPKAAATTPRPEPAAPLAVGHKDVGCVVAGRHPRFEACLTPADAVGRAQVLFRADEKGPWFSVDMKREGSCHAALLPKPTKDIERFHYFIEAVDRSFTMALQPGAAPAQSYAPRVVSRESDCGKDLLVAAANPNGSVIVNVARDAGGKVLQGSAQAAGTPVSLTGFSMDGVTMPGNATASSAAPAAAAAGGGIGLGVIAIGAGVVAVGATVAVVAGGGDAASGGGDDSGSSSLTGRWSGTAANGGGATYVYALAGFGSCTVVSDLVLDFVQSGASLTGTGSGTRRSMTCTFATPGDFSIGASGSGPLSGTTAGNSVTFRTGTELSWTFNGTRVGSRIEGTATPPPEAVTSGVTWTTTWSVFRQ